MKSASVPDSPPRSSVSVRMVQVFRDEPLDFVLFFSSMTAFLKSPGQSNYAAGCAFEDSFARAHVWTRPNIAVKVINWGYWGSVALPPPRSVRRVSQPSALPPLSHLKPWPGLRPCWLLLCTRLPW